MSVRQGFPKISALAVAALLLWAGGVSAEAPRRWLLSYEVLSSQHDVSVAKRAAPYADHEALTRQSLARLVPRVFAAMGAKPAAVRSRIGPGGYKDAVNPAIQSDLMTVEAEGKRLAAALGLVFEQWAVLLSDLAPERGETNYVSVAVTRGALTPARAELFFAHARWELASNKLGFSAFGNRMIFFNVATGIADPEFLAGLRRAAAAQPALPLLVTGPHPARALFVENDWAKARDGEDYRRLIGAAALEAPLRLLRDEHRAAVKRWVARP
jgi:hypothetical protein